MTRHLRISDLDDGSTTLLQIALLHDALDCQAENEFRASEAARKRD
ncbi:MULTISPECIES: DUF6889 family protein [Asaia]|nr:hypothetical protein P792_00375 [Asaia sp. SF2.1]